MKKGPYTIRRDELTQLYRRKAENIVRFFYKLGMSTKEKEMFLAKEFADVHMHIEMMQKGLRMLERVDPEKK